LTLIIAWITARARSSINTSAFQRTRVSTSSLLSNMRNGLSLAMIQKFVSRGRACQRWCTRRFGDGCHIATHRMQLRSAEKRAPIRRPASMLSVLLHDQPLDARAARRDRRPLPVSLAPVSDDAELPLDVLGPAPAVLPPMPPAPAPVDELAPALLRDEPLVPPVVPDLSGFAAPICPAAVPAPARPALSVSAGEPCAAYAPATAADIAPATSAIMSFLIACLPKVEIDCRDTSSRGRGHTAEAMHMPMSSLSMRERR
jgi:hypothetical protein